MPGKQVALPVDKRPGDPRRSCVRQSRGGGGMSSRQPLPLVSVDPKSKIVVPAKLPPLQQDVVAPLAVWPSNAKRAAVAGSKAPLAVQLEAFIRREYGMRSRESRSSSRCDTLHIAREAFSVVMDHFAEYKEVFSFIRDEYEAVFDELYEEVRQLRSQHHDYSNERSLHSMEMLKLREGFRSVISNQYAQLQATQSLVHSLRDKILACEDANLELRKALARKEEENKDAEETAKMLTKNIIEDSARSAKLLATHKEDLREISRLNTYVNTLKEKVDETEKRYDALLRQFLASDRSEECAAWAKSTRDAKVETPVQIAEPEEITEAKDVTDPTIVELTKRVDELLYANCQLRHQLEETQPQAEVGSVSEHCSLPSEGVPPSSGSRRALSKTGGGDGDKEPCKNCLQLVQDCTSSSLIKLWLQEEYITEMELDKFDTILPPGKNDDHPFGFLRACKPIRNRHMKCEQVAEILNKFWDARQFNRQTQLKRFFLEWLQNEAGSEAAGQDLGMNILHTCERNPDDPYCRSMMLVLNSFLPEDVVMVFRESIGQMEKKCVDELSDSMGFVQVPQFWDLVRNNMPEKTYEHMLHIRFYLSRHVDVNGKLSVRKLFDKNSYFIRMLKKQFLCEVERFTLQVIEAIRTVSEDEENVRLCDVREALSSQDRGIPKGSLCRLVAEATELTAMDVATAEPTMTVKLQPLLRRFRSAVLLRRVTPPHHSENLSSSDIFQRMIECRNF
ncbi:putative Translin associated factor X interacting N terminus [Trypanosoma vivax]|uniref:Translin-associated factor X-interacting protein 1 N-terminal domain-containing protein n=1 Tax=Trypanosoma vivax (strain Y486) TaxID=1055687 RepID=G0U9W2_TRYVY|nr:hypothetical protein TRVL_02112 [Trypanosoma vivax]KAH8619026.1 putative Translin associated factor X interacting N terminus [Trypanosoma vivax]CCC52593.1 conserved hypothetical protein [Trypanosoma vivax Y486]